MTIGRLLVRLLRVGSWISVLPLAVGTMSAASILYSNYGPSHSYDTNTAWIVNSSGTGFNPAMPFSPSTTATLEQILVNIGVDLGTSSLNVDLSSDSGGVPGTVLEAFNITSAPDALNGVTFPPLVLQSLLHPLLQAGQQYWLSATASDPSGQFGWWFNSTGDSGQVYLADNGVPGFTSDTRGAFEITGTVHEPAAWMYMTAGIIALLLTRRVAHR